MAQSRHIFIVDDNEIYSMMLDYILSKDTVYKFVSFKSGEECLENLYLNPEIIILDYEMPGLNGYETLLEIKKRKPEIHVMILTNHEDPGLREKLLEAGADDFILKQRQGETHVVEKIDEILGNREADPVVGARPKNMALYVLVIAILVTLGILYYV